MARANPKPISRRALLLLLGFAGMTLMVVSVLFYHCFSRPAISQNVALSNVAPPMAGGDLVGSAPPSVKMGEDLLTIGIAKPRIVAAPVPAPPAVAPAAQPAATPAADPLFLTPSTSKAISKALSEEDEDPNASRPSEHLARAKPSSSESSVPNLFTGTDKNDNNDLVPPVKGPSYTAKKMASGMPDTPPVKNGRQLKKKPPPPVAAKPPPKAPAKSAQPAAPAGLGDLDTRGVDFSKAPTYVLNDGRRIRALSVRENGTQITVKNEKGLDVTFKKSDVKEILPG